MPLIDVVTVGNGTAYVDIPNPSQGETVTLYCDPATGETLLDVEAWDENGYSIAMGVYSPQPFVFNYQAMTIKVTFSETIPTQKIFISTTGNGTAVVDIDNPDDGDTVTLICSPDRKWKLKSILAEDKYGGVIPLTLTDTQTFTWDDTWEEMYIYVDFAKKRQKGNMPIWMYPYLRG